MMFLIQVVFTCLLPSFPCQTPQLTFTTTKNKCMAANVANPMRNHTPIHPIHPFSYLKKTPCQQNRALPIAQVPAGEAAILHPSPFRLVRHQRLPLSDLHSLRLDNAVPAASDGHPAQPGEDDVDAGLVPAGACAGASGLVVGP